MFLCTYPTRGRDKKTSGQIQKLGDVVKLWQAGLSSDGDARKGVEFGAHVCGGVSPTPDSERCGSREI
jgi:hypothetical protein